MATEIAETSADMSGVLRVNAELARLLRTEPVSISFGSEAASRDTLVICGLLGGKDVGKSTLINVLAKQRVSRDEAEVGRGTDHVVAYVHTSARDAVENRLRALDAHVPIEIVTHEADAVRNAALVDLPDFDSDFLEHLHIVRAVTPLLDRVLWVLTPRKVGDRAWAELVQDVVKDGTNVRFVLNKVDELLTDADALDGEAGSLHQGRKAAEAFWHRQQSWFMDTTAAVVPVAARDDCFLIAAAYPTDAQFTSRVAHLWDDPLFRRFSAEQDTVREIGRLVGDDVDRLRAAVLDPVDESLGRRIKEANRRTELAIGAKRIREEYDLERMAAQLAHAVDPEYAGELLDEAFPPAYRNEVQEIVRATLAADRRLADEWLERRVDQWPLLRIIYWPFGWAARIAGRGAGPRGRAAGWFKADTTKREDWKSPLDVAAPAANERIELMRARLLADHSAIAKRLGWDRELPESDRLSNRLEARANELPQQIHERMLAAFQESDRKPSILGRAMLWLLLLWFPFLQPVLAGALEIIGEGGTWHTARGLLRIVSALSATHLLAGFAVVAVVYLTLIAGMYARRLRKVKRWRAEYEVPLIADAVDEMFLSELSVPLIEPVKARKARLDGLLARLTEATNGAARLRGEAPAS